MSSLAKKGFTIIEVVLVLAIGGLIFLVVFMGIPQLQESRRDNQRRRDAEALLAIGIDYHGNYGDVPRWAHVHSAFTAYNSGSTSTSPFYPYIENENFADPQLGEYTVASNTGLYSAPIAVGEIWVGGFTRCTTPGSNAPAEAGSSLDFVVVVGLESGANYCVQRLVS